MYSDYPKFNTKATGMDQPRERVRMRDNWTCQKCEKVWNPPMRRFDCHHLNGLCGKLSRAYDNNLEGMITLCHKCHGQEHAYKEGCKKGKATTEEISRIRDLFGCGMSRDKIAKEVGFSYVTVRKYTLDL